MRTSPVQLALGEYVLREEGVSRANLMFSLAVCAIALLLGEFILAVIVTSLQPLMAFGGPSGTAMLAWFSPVASLVFAAAVLIAVGQAFLVALSARYTLTDRRLLTSRGLVARAMSQADLYRIQGVRVRQDFIGRILNYGHVYVETAGTAGTIAIRFVNDPTGWAHALSGRSHPAPVTFPRY